MEELLIRIAEALEDIADQLACLEMDQEITADTVKAISRTIKRRGRV